MASTPHNGLRFYGVIDAESAGKDQLDTLKIQLVTYRELAAVVAPAPYARGTPDDAALQDFVRVVDALSANGPMIPAPAGTVFRNESVLSRWLDVHYAKLHEALGVIERRSDGRAPYDYVRMELGA
ncbi:MAG TPA: GvpL/GvpF family gas vesicle protein [Gemmatimonadaceae bacterium]